MTPVPAYQYHQIVGEACVLYTQVLAFLGHLLCFLQHLIHLIEIDVAEQRRNYASHAIEQFSWRSRIERTELRKSVPDGRKRTPVETTDRALTPL